MANVSAAAYSPFNHSADPNLSGKLRATVQFSLYGVALPCICTLGMIANLLSIIIFCQKKMRSSISIYLAGLSVFDFLLLFFATLIYPSISYCYDLRHEIFCRFLTSYILATYPLSLIVQFGSVWICVAITVDRYLAVKFPLRVKQLCTVRRACLLVTAISVIGILYRIPAMFELRIEGGRLDQTAFGASTVYQLIYKTYLYLAVMYLIPFAAMIVLNTLITVALREAQRQRQLMGGNRAGGRGKRERHCTVMAVLVTVTFLLFNAPAFLNNILDASKTDERQLWRYTMVYLSNVLVCLNALANFIIYYALGKQCGVVPAVRICRERC